MTIKQTILGYERIANTVVFKSSLYFEENKINSRYIKYLKLYMISAFNDIFKIGIAVGLVVGMLSVLITLIII